MSTPCDSSKRVVIPIVILICILLTPQLGAATFSRSPDTPIHDERSSPDDGGWFRYVPSIIRHFLIRAQELLGVPRP
jgi:hypothetical protein